MEKQQETASADKRSLPMTKCLTAWIVLFCGLVAANAEEGASVRPHGWIGYRQFRTNLPGGRWANTITMRAWLVRADGTERRQIGEELIDEPYASTGFGGWSPDGKTAIISRGWSSPENGRWEEEHRTFRSSGWRGDLFLLDMATGRLTNVTAVERVSPCNSGISYLPGGQKLLMTTLIDGVSKVFTMDLDGRNKRDVSGETGGFIYGVGASPDGKRISYHENYHIYVADADGSNKMKIETGQPFNFGPSWSPDGQWILFVSGERGKSNPYIVRGDGTGLRKLADVNGYQGWVLFLDVDDFHEGSSDVPTWGKEGPWVYLTVQAAEGMTEIWRASIDGKLEQLTHSKPGTLNCQPIPSPDGKWICFGSNRTGTRQLYVMRADGSDVYPITDVPPHWGAQWPAWQPAGE